MAICWLPIAVLVTLESLLLQASLLSQTPSTSPASEVAEPARPPFKQLRYEEDRGFLRDPNGRTDYLDVIKFIPLGKREGWFLSIGGEIRPYYELYRNEDWGAEPDDDNGFLLQRYMLHADLHLGRHLRFFGQLKSGLEVGRKGGPQPPDEDKLDVHQAFVDLAWQFDKTRSVVFRAGRQELSLGSSRLVSTREGPNVRQSFDGLRLSLRARQWVVDGFAMKPVETNQGFFDDLPNHARAFWGVYAVRPLPVLPLQGSVDIYYLGLDKKRARFDQGTGRERRYTVGTRLWNPRGTLDYNFELVYQFGVFEGRRQGDIRAWTVAADTGYMLGSAPLKPRIGLKANVTSGDKDPNDPDLETVIVTRIRDFVDGFRVRRVLPVCAFAQPPAASRKSNRRHSCRSSFQNPPVYIP